MRPLDETDRDIIRLLQADGRRSYSEIGEAVGLTGPAVSDRIDRLRERGVIRGFSVDLDRTVLSEGLPFLLDLEIAPGRAGAVAEALLELTAVERVVRTAGERVLAIATVPGGEPTTVLQEAGIMDAVAGVDVDLIASREVDARLGAAEFTPECVECGNSVDAEGVRAAVGDETYYFCCESCEAAFRERYETIEEGA
jgi:DNA-binding Lrp family transcriptional regulator/YHS domain-containing protein